MTRARIVEFLTRLADKIARFIVRLLPRIIKYWTVLMAVSKYAADNPRQVAGGIDALNVITSLKRK